ncbi:type I 3-dehydroquinate dehydratase [Brevibacterium renqingii]|uniref:type I 3-dehydroquinate dehydratase n=1 Tax=Brevibacterium renqingii TaxID=2776916 RepID=UPI001ADFA4F6|nr:type I 3-dehydroquinate dehydratase [Brevibacterium renqingii]
MKPLPFLNPAAGTPAARNPARPAVIVPTQGVDSEELSAQCAAVAATGVVDVIEWRIDPLLARSIAGGSLNDEAPAVVSGEVPGSAAPRAEEVLELLPQAAAAGLPVLLTARTAGEGGLVEIAADEYAEVLRRLIAGLADAEVGAVPVAIDVEIDRAEARELIASAREHGIPTIASLHDFESTGSYEALLATFRSMADAGADVAKAAMMPQTPADVCRLLAATAKADVMLGVPVLGISMGALGRTSRIMGADFGSCATFAQIGEASAPGQIDAARLAEILDRVCD